MGEALQQRPESEEIRAGREAMIAELQQRPPGSQVADFMGQTFCVESLIRELEEGTRTGRMNGLLYSRMRRFCPDRNPPSTQVPVQPTGIVGKGIQAIRSLLQRH